jgi:hypothetical protein
MFFIFNQLTLQAKCFRNGLKRSDDHLAPVLLQLLQYLLLLLLLQHFEAALVVRPKITAVSFCLDLFELALEVLQLVSHRFIHLLEMILPQVIEKIILQLFCLQSLQLLRLQRELYVVHDLLFLLRQLAIYLV